jgi:hypothetical protein
MMDGRGDFTWLEYAMMAAFVLCVGIAVWTLAE